MTDKDKDPWIGTTYDYANAIKQPSDICNDDKICVGNIKAGWTGIGVDLGATLSYIEVLLEGGNNGAMHGGFNGNDTSALPLGNRYFIKTPGKCKNGKERYVYISNVPNGDIPLISDFGGGNMNFLKGLIPGALSNLEVLNPKKLINSLTEGSDPECVQVTLPVFETVKEAKEKIKKETKYVAISDLEIQNGCDFPLGENGESEKDNSGKYKDGTIWSKLLRKDASCGDKEGFVTYNDQLNNYLKNNDNVNGYTLKKTNAFTNMYIISLSILLTYLLYKLMKK
jgi:hypothetical protein